MKYNILIITLGTIQTEASISSRSLIPLITSIIDEKVVTKDRNKKIVSVINCIIVI